MTWGWVYGRVLIFGVNFKVTLNYCFLDAHDMEIMIKWLSDFKKILDA